MLTDLFHHARLLFTRHQIWALGIAQDAPILGLICIPTLFIWMLWPVLVVLLIFGPGPHDLNSFFYGLVLAWVASLLVFMIWYMRWFVISLSLLIGIYAFADKMEAKLQQSLQKQIR